ncbi:TraR/DksA family transcriptional regulator [Maribellus maritimus]|uniref:TraR/DksA family transcriptional regulator n=1 Tax=Maribellus maritimus TaxID=2870838 RepID=UPI001EEAFCF1|nr:TraR/DksA C4-type zinc finger protein [Maribellus maritimus]MCG6186268.1 TraR/DksA C4-type zinc finger protein [Maribellus maritimus]
MPKLNKPEIKQKIESEIQRTEKLISEYIELTQPVEPENAIGRISRMDAINNKSVTEAALRKAREKMDKLKFALSKINEENFGICIRCKAPIPVGRLLVMPQSQTCVKCSY